MFVKAPTTAEPRRLAVARDMRSFRDVLRQIRRHVQMIDLTLFGSRKSVKVTRHLDRRHYHRSPIRMAIRISPAAYDGRYVQLLPAAENSLRAVTRDVSMGGVGLLHDKPILADHAIITFDLLDGAPLSLLAQIRWTNPEQYGHYMSGGSWAGVPQPLDD